MKVILGWLFWCLIIQYVIKWSDWYQGLWVVIVHGSKLASLAARLQGTVEELPAAPFGVATCCWAMLWTQPSLVQIPAKTSLPGSYFPGCQAVVVKPTQMHGLRQWWEFFVLFETDWSKMQSGVNDAPFVPEVHFISLSAMARYQTWQPVDFHGVGKIDWERLCRGAWLAQPSAKLGNDNPVGVSPCCRCSCPVGLFFSVGCWWCCFPPWFLITIPSKCCFILWGPLLCCGQAATTQIRFEPSIDGGWGWAPGPSHQVWAPRMSKYQNPEMYNPYIGLQKATNEYVMEYFPTLYYDYL